MRRVHARHNYHIKFVLSSRGSLQELIDDLNVCEDEQYLSPAEVATLKQDGWQVLRLINGYLRHLRDSKTSTTLQVQETPPSFGESDDDLEEWIASLPV